MFFAIIIISFIWTCIKIHTFQLVKKGENRCFYKMVKIIFTILGVGTIYKKKNNNKICMCNIQSKATWHGQYLASS